MFGLRGHIVPLPNWILGILVKASENDPENAIFVNSYFPNWLAKITKNTQTKIIHLSTDCVFSGKTGYYLDTDEPDGTGVYSRSKALGEIVNNKDLTVRMSIIGSELKKGGSGLFSWFLRSKGTVKGYSGALWNGLTTLELAKAIDALIGSDIVGLYQLAPTYSISKYALLKLIKEIWKKKNVKIIPDLGLIQNKTLVNSKQQIPNYVMPDSYRTMLQEYKDYLDANESK